MSAVNAPLDSASKSASKHKKKKSKKKGAGQQQSVDHGTAPPRGNGTKAGDDDDDDDDEEAVGVTSSAPVKEGEAPTRNGHGTLEPAASRVKDDTRADTAHGIESDDSDTSPSPDPTARLDAMQQERDTLRAEVTQLRKALESLQEKHNDELASVKDELEQSQEGKEHAETQYRNLLGKVNTIRSQLGERLKADAAELETARERIDELEKSNAAANTEGERLQQQIAQLNATLASHVAEIESLRSRTNLSTHNWAKERDDMLQREAALREEYEVARQAMQDWEILATEERSRREALEEKTQELEEQLGTQQQAYARIQSDAEIQSNTVDGLQRALRDLQEERKRELREMVEQSQSQLDALRAQTKAAEETAASLQTQLETTQAELARAAPFEKEVKEKNLLIGKLRHEAVILNDHLTKALRFLKRGKPEDNVDRQLVTNHFLHFLALDRSDPKKFQILQLIAALLGWDETQKEQAGLLRAGTVGSSSAAIAAGGSLRVPLSPFRRTPSTPTLGEFVPESPGGASRESLAELWSEFLEREAEAGSATAGSRRPSVASSSKGGAAAAGAGFRSPSIGGLASPSSSLRGVPEHTRQESRS